MWAFVHIHKTAGTTITHILRRSYGVRHYEVDRSMFNTSVFTAEDYVRLHMRYPWIKSIAGHNIRPYSDLDKACPAVQYYTFLREPLERCASHYQHHPGVRGETLAFEDWIKVEKNRNRQTRRLAGDTADVSDAISILEETLAFVGLVERFDESMLMLRRRIGDPHLDLWYRAERVAPDNSLKHLLLTDPAKRNLLIEANQLDTELYNYVAQELFPRLKREYGSTLTSALREFHSANRARRSARSYFNYGVNRFLALRHKGRRIRRLWGRTRAALSTKH